MDELIRVSRAILEDFDLYGQPISLRLLAELRRAVEAAQQSMEPTLPSGGGSVRENIARINESKKVR